MPIQKSPPTDLNWDLLEKYYGHPIHEIERQKIRANFSNLLTLLSELEIENFEKMVEAQKTADAMSLQKHKVPESP